MGGRRREAGGRGSTTVRGRPASALGGVGGGELGEGRGTAGRWWHASGGRRRGHHGAEGCRSGGIESGALSAGGPSESSGGRPAGSGTERDTVEGEAGYVDRGYTCWGGLRGGLFVRLGDGRRFDEGRRLDEGPRRRRHGDSIA